MAGRLCLLLAFALGLVAIILTSTRSVYIVRSASMAPTINAGDAVMIRPLADMPGVGDIITYEQSGKVITHRVVRVENGAAFTKGDGTLDEDPWAVRSFQIRGRVLLDLPLLGYFFAFLQQPGGWFLFVILPAMLVISIESRRIWGQYRAWRQESASPG